MFSNNLSNSLSFVLKCIFRMLNGIIVTVLQCSVTMWQPNKEDTKYNKSMGIIIFHQFSLGAELCPTHATLESLPGLANTLGLQWGLHSWEEVQGLFTLKERMIVICVSYWSIFSKHRPSGHISRHFWVFAFWMIFPFKKKNWIFGYSWSTRKPRFPMD